MSTHPVFFLHLRAPNTPNGNPNRVYVAVDIVAGDVVGAWDEGYRGLDSIPREWKGAGFYGTSSPLAIEVKAREAKAFLRVGRDALKGYKENARRRSSREVKAAQKGTAAGKSAASWRFDGNTTDETYRAALKGIEDGDPEVLDAMNEPEWLSGQWAGESISELLGDLIRGDDSDDDVMQAYEDAASTAFWHEIERTARYHAGGKSR